ncbi:MAG TPA: hypothetical protein VGW36_06330 [Pyrinomonadaceae bacterium]|nr:hypothetical protein [Pyrinomonadaceae bacterium]
MIETNKPTNKLVSTEAVLPVDAPGAIPPLRLQPDAAQIEKSRYTVDELVCFHDRVFVERVYAALSETEPSEGEVVEVLDDLRSGRRDKIEIIQRVFSERRGTKNVTVEGLPSPMLQSIGRWPIVGHFLRLLRALYRLPLMLQHQQQFEAYTAAQQQELTDYLNEVASVVNDHTTLNEQWAVTLADAVDNTIMLSDSLVELSAKHARLQTDLEKLQLQTHSQLQSLQGQREVSEKQINTNLLSLTEGLTKHQQHVTDTLRTQQQYLDELKRDQDETASAQREFLVQEQRVIVEAQKVALAELQEQIRGLNEEQRSKLAEVTAELQRVRGLITAPGAPAALTGRKSKQS